MSTSEQQAAATSAARATAAAIGPIRRAVPRPMTPNATTTGAMSPSCTTIAAKTHHITAGY
ncbi:MAG TPA: hypothetical protein DEA59_04830 [Microbacterium sp.]|nr:hypothetical protein [Microbacterium sp.]|tara:strand:+ start:1334 stop:1516 length:183 start_codon:yes stop_codon:yes gene_type:complete